MVAIVQYILLYRLNTLLGIESMCALPALLFSGETMIRLVSFDLHQVQHEVDQQGATKRRGPRTTETIPPDVRADHPVKVNVRDIELRQPSPGQV
jgi:hypothetical protein